MKKCPYCQKGNDDEEIQCWNCGEWFETVSPPKQRNVVKPPKREQSGTDSVDWQTKLEGVFNKYRIPIISIIIIAGLLFTISQNANFNKNAEQVAGIEPPKIDAPAAPAPEPDPHRQRTLLLHRNLPQHLVRLRICLIMHLHCVPAENVPIPKRLLNI